jgi:probable DNA repair protein
MATRAITQAELFERLAQGRAARLAVVAPTTRLARALTAEFDAAQAARGLRVWESPDILPVDRFVARCHEDALYAEGAEDLPRLLSPAQARHLWEQAIAESRWGGALLAVGDAARQCERAWRLQHRWRLGAGRGNEDAAAFSEWSRAYERRARGWTDEARLPDAVAGRVARAPAQVVAYGFDLIEPQIADFLSAFALAECAPARAPAQARKLSLPSRQAELEAAARWARARLESGARRIGVVVPKLAEVRREVQRAFARQPGLPFEVSAAPPLAERPLVDAALGILALASSEIPFERASRLIRSPFLGGAESEMAGRARLDVAFRRKSRDRVSLPSLVSHSREIRMLRERLEGLFKLSKAGLRGVKPPHEWARLASALLQAAGFPGERPLDSAEFQARAKLHEALGELAALERVAGAMAFADFLRRLEALCRETPFQPESAEPPIQVLDLLESAGAGFDCLWVSGLTDQAWPLPAQANPFLPVAPQKAAGIPEASAEASLERARRVTEGWLGAAAEVVLSWPRLDEDRALAPSPLLRDVPEGDVAIPGFPDYRRIIFEQGKFESREDAKALPLEDPQVRGGTRVLADQAACPFRAFARWRLGAEPLDSPTPGPDAAERGLLLHSLMKALWGELKGSSALKKDLEAAIQKAASMAVKESGLEGRFAALEQARLARLAAEWLEVERARGEFEVKALEEKRALQAGGLRFSGRIDRLDRLASGGHALIDYKTGRVSRAAWEGERPDEPQLPLYAVNAPEQISRIAFAKLRTGQMEYLEVETSRQKLADWKKTLDALGQAFAAGEAGVRPKRLFQTCRYCGLEPLCRVHEKFSALEQADEG